jgi:hypothetical protein
MVPQWMRAAPPKARRANMDKLKPWLFTFVGVVVSLAIINRVAFVRNLVYPAAPAA